MPLDKAKEKERKRLYHIANKEKANERNRLWKLANKEKVKEYNVNYAKNNPEGSCKKAKKWRQDPKNFEAVQIGRWKAKGMMIGGDWKLFHLNYKNTNNCELCNLQFGSQNIKKEMKCCDHDHHSGYIRFVCCQKCNNHLSRIDSLKNVFLLELHRYFKINLE
tara:strand:+ start:193 stop:681 length:489 start_codon:yes stop_codon:yes gene_type:complete